MSRPKSALALVALMLIALASAANATTQYSCSCYVENFDIQTGYFSWYQGTQSIWDHFSWSWGTPIKWGYLGSGGRAYPRDCGYCIFKVPSFHSLSTPVCTLYYYQLGHSGSANLLINEWENPLTHWTPVNEADYDACFFAIWNSHDTVTTDVAHSTDGAWYKVPLTPRACTAIADTAAANQNMWYWTGWVYPGTSDAYTTAHGVGENLGPFIRVWYEWY